MEVQFIRECEEHEKLAHILKWLKNQVIDVIVLGGWLFNGRLEEIEDEQVILCEVTVTSCRGMTLSVFEVPQVTICLDDIISAGKPVPFVEL